MNHPLAKLQAALVAASCLFATSLYAADPAVTGTYDLTFASGQVGIYTVHSVTNDSAVITYSYGGKQQTAELPIRKQRIMGSGWFPTAWFDETSIKRAAFPGNRAAAKRTNTK
ncbi:MAG: hypothetical protein AAF754_02700 [Pseudomonadota bacterium]